MSEKFLNRYRIPSSRMKGWDYRSNGAYFITICTQHRNSFFGKIVDYQFIENNIGAIARQCWTEIPKHCLQIERGCFVIMPNHIHGILIIDHPRDDSIGKTANASVETLHATSLQPRSPLSISVIAPKMGSIATAIRSFKSAVSKHARQINPDFEWQTRYHDHISRDFNSYQTICNYIETNPEHWHEDRLYK